MNMTDLTYTITSPKALTLLRVSEMNLHGDNFQVAIKSQVKGKER